MSSGHEARHAHPCVIGILGAVASGKSTVASLMAQHGAKLIDADRIGHEVLQRPEVRDKVRAEFGEGVFAADGCVDRAKLAELVFGSRENLERLNGIVHPLILDAVERTIRQAERPGRPGIVVLDAALLMETGLDKRYCNVLVFVDSDRDARQARAERDRGWDSAQLSLRDSAQLSPEVKKQQAHFVLENNGTVAELEEKIRSLMGRIRERLWIMSN
jgi:dephospho-CoA kinase